MTEATTHDIPGLNAAAVQRWLVENVAGVVAPVEFALLAGGHSNLTYTATDAAGHRYVVRRPPLAQGVARANDVAREHLIINALAPTIVPVPTPLGLCTDESVNGRPFYVMDFTDGAVVDNPAAAERALPTPESRRRASEQLVDVLADLHRVDVDAVGLGGSAKREGFLERHLRRIQSVWEQTKTRELPLLDEMHDRLAARAPRQRYTGIVHSDYRFGNVILDADATLVAVLDWELWTLGDVLADVGFVLNNWYEPDDDTPMVWMEVPPTVAGGFASRQEVIDRYAERTGFDLSEIEYYRAFAHWKMAVIAEGVKRRYETGAMASRDVDFGHLDRRIVRLAELAAHHFDLATRGA
jgi:aminoglycoside phosphotransferase (APT) family kinase protein